MKFGTFLLVYLLILTASNANAQTPPSGNDNVGGVWAPAGSYGADPGVPMVGLNPYTGNALRVVDDLSVASISEIGLNFTRYAHSRTYTSTITSYAQLQLFGEGMPWRHSFQWDVYLTGINRDGNLLVTYPNGTFITFTQIGTTGSFTAPFPVTDVASIDASGNAILTTASHVIYKFANLQNIGGYTHYGLVSITDSKGLVTTVQNSAYWYGGSYQFQLPTKITEPGGRWLSLSYSYLLLPRSEVAYISEVDSSDGRKATFSYGVTGSGGSAQAVLTGVSYSGIASASYGYYSTGTSSPFGPPQYSLSQAIDSRAEGLANIKYGYFSGSTGAVQTVTEGSANTLVCTLSLQGGNAQTPQLTFPDGSYFKYSYQAGGLLTGATNSQSNSQSFSYADSGTGTWTTTTTDANGNITIAKETSTGLPISVTLPPVAGQTSGPTKTYAYNAAGYLTSFTDNLGHTTTLTRAPTSNLITQVTYADTTTESYTYNSFNEILNHTQRNGGVEHFTYDATGLLLTKQDATQTSGQVTTIAYNSNYRIASVTDANNHSTSYQYNDAGQVTTQTNPDNTTRTFVYGTNKVVSVTNELGYTGTYTYDGFGRIVSSTDPLGRVTTYAYGSPTNPHPTSVTMPGGKVKAASYTPAWQYETSTITEGYGTADAATTTYGYDAVGNVIGVTDPRGETTIIDYDARNRKVAAQDPAGNDSFFYYDDNDDLTETTTPDGNTFNVYDVMGRLLQSTDPKGQNTYMTYDSEGSLSTYKDPNGHIYSYSSDLDERQLSMQYPDSSTESYSYDPVGNLATFTTRDGKVKTLTYDNRDRVTGYSWNDGITPSVSIGYDNGSRVTSLANSNSTLTYTYDNDDELLTEKQNVTGLGAKTVTYAYNSDSTLNTLTYPDSTGLTYGYNNRNQVTGISQGGTSVASYSYDAAGNPVTKNLANGVNSTLTYDTVERLTSITDLAGSTPIQSFNYGYDAMSRRKYVKRNGGLGDVYTYDVSGQLSNVQYNATNPDTTPTSPQRTTSFAYDSSGNRTQVVDSVQGTSTYTANADNQYTGIGSLTLSYDTKGNLVSNNGWTYTYDAENRIIQAQSSSNTVTFFYDASGRCVKRVDGGAASYFVYDTAWSVLADYNSSGTLTNRYVVGARTNEILTKTDSSNNVLYYHFDGLGSVTKLTSSSGAIVEQYSYDVFGNATIQNASGSTISSSACGNRFLFAGSEYIASMDLYQNRERMYSARMGRFLQPDPEGHSGDAYNLYRYCGNDPINNVDTFGDRDEQTDPNIGGIPIIIGSPGELAGPPPGTFNPNELPMNPGDPPSFSLRPIADNPYSSPSEGPNYGIPSPPANWESLQGSNSSAQIGIGMGNRTGNYLGGLQIGLDIAGFIPFVGIPANAASAAISFSKGDYFGAATSVFAMIPVVGVLGKIAKLGKVAEEVRGGVYALKYEGEIVRTGRTNDLVRRAGEHFRDPVLGDLEFTPLYKTDSYFEQRGLEQLVHEQNAPILNKINPVNPLNPLAHIYRAAANDFLKQ